MGSPGASGVSELLGGPAALEWVDRKAMDMDGERPADAVAEAVPTPRKPGTEAVGREAAGSAEGGGHEAPGTRLSVLEEYDLLSEPRVYVRILEDEFGRRFYHVVEPELGGVGERVRRLVMTRILRDLDLLREFSEIDELAVGIRRALELVKPVMRGFAREARREGLEPEAVSLAVAYYVARDIVGYGRLDPLIRDPHIEDISCNGLYTPVFVYHNTYEWLTSGLVFDDPRELEQVVMKLALRAGVEPSLARPVVEGVLRPEGYRVHIILDVVSRRGHNFTIRKFRAEPFTIVELLQRKTLEPGIAAMLWAAIQYKQAVVIYGPTGSGKTTLLNALAMLLPPEYKIVTVEDTPEIYLPFHDNWAALHTRLSDMPGVQNVTLQAQVESALRMRPDVIIVGEIRSREAFAFFQAIATGHGGLTTVHAESADVLIRRLASPPMNVPKSLMAAAKLYVNILRIERGGEVLRRVTRVDETAGYDPDRDEITLRRLFQWSRETDEWSYTGGPSPAFVRSLAELLAVSPETVWRDLEMRATVLRWAAEKNMDMIELHETVRKYMRDPEKVYREALAEGAEPYRFPRGQG